MSYQQYLDTYNTFFELKDKYDSKRVKTIKTLKKKHPGNIQLIKEGLNKFDQKRRCINCKKPGGTLFEIAKKTLKCICNADKKCNLHIELRKSDNINLPEMIKKNVNTINSLKQDILVYKLDLLFGTLSEDVVLNQFTRLKSILDETISEKNTYQELYDKKNKILEIENEGKEKENTFILKDEFIKEKEKTLNNLVSEIKKFIVEYKKTNNKSILSDLINMYKNTILPLQDELRQHKYDEIFIEKKENNKGNKGSLKLMPKYIIHKSNTSIENKMTYNKFKVIKNNK